MTTVDQFVLTDDLEFLPLNYTEYDRGLEILAYKWNNLYPAEKVLQRPDYFFGSKWLVA